MLGTLALYLFLAVIIIFHTTVETYLMPLLKETDAQAVFHYPEDIFYQKRIRRSLLALLTLVIWPFLNFDWRFLSLIIGLSFYLYKQPYWKQKHQKKQQIRQLQFQFPIWLRQLQILIQTNTIHQALIASTQTAPSLIRDDLHHLIEATSRDAISIQPYLSFLNEYHLAEVERAMKLLYRYQSVGKADAYQQLQRMIETTAKWIRAERKERFDTRLMFYQWWGMLPLLGVTVMFMAVMFQIILNLFGKGVIG